MTWKINSSYIEKEKFFLERRSNKLTLFHILFFLFLYLYFNNYSTINKEIDLNEKIIILSPIFIIYYIGFVYFFSKERIFITSEYLILEKKFLFYCSRKIIEIKNIRGVIFTNYEMSLFEIVYKVIINCLCFWTLNSVKIEVLERKKLKEYYFGKNMKKEEFILLIETYIKIAKNKNKDFIFSKIQDDIERVWKSKSFSWL